MDGPTASELCDFTAVHAAHLIAIRQLSPVELVEARLRRIDDGDPRSMQWSLAPMSARLPRRAAQPMH